MTNIAADTALRVVALILEKYDVEPIEIMAPQKGYRNSSYPVALADGRRLNLILYKDEPGIEQKIINANRVSDYLASLSFPARKTQDQRIVRLSSPAGHRYSALYGYLPGTTIPWEAYTMDHIKVLGKTMSDMHNALRSYPLDTARLPSVTDEYAAILKRMQRYFCDEGVTDAMHRKLQLRPEYVRIAEVQDLLASCSRLDDQQILHMDFVRGNILFADDEELKNDAFSLNQVRLTGILDFEKVAIGHPVFDIARTLAFLLVDCKYKAEDKVRKYFLKSGYNKRGAAHYDQVFVDLNGVKVDLLESLIDMFLLHDFYKFLRHNPYEFLVQNEHYVRTRDILVRRNMLVSL